MTRRALFAALASLPFVGRFVKEPEKPMPSPSAWTWTPTELFRHAVRRDVTGSGTIVTFVKDPVTGNWHEFQRYSDRL